MAYLPVFTPAQLAAIAAGQGATAPQMPVPNLYGYRLQNRSGATIHGVNAEGNLVILCQPYRTQSGGWQDSSQWLTLSVKAGDPVVTSGDYPTSSWDVEIDMLQDPQPEQETPISGMLAGLANVTILNSVLTVTITNSSLNVFVTNSVLTVSVTGTVNALVTNSTLNVLVTNSSLTVVVSGTANVNITNSVLTVTISGTTNVLITNASVTITGNVAPGVSSTNLGQRLIGGSAFPAGVSIQGTLATITITTWFRCHISVIVNYTAAATGWFIAEAFIESNLGVQFPIGLVTIPQGGGGTGFYGGEVSWTPVYPVSMTSIFGVSYSQLRVTIIYYAQGSVGNIFIRAILIGN